MSLSVEMFHGLDDRDTVTVSVGRLRELVATAAADAPEILSTVQASAIIGFSHSYWRDKASNGLVEGAFQDGDRWRLPTRSCKKYVAQLQAHHRRSVLRGPRRKAS